MKLFICTAILALAAADCTYDENSSDSHTQCSTANPETCSHVTCDVIQPHTCAYNANNYFGANTGGLSEQNFLKTMGMQYSGTNDCSTHGGRDECGGSFQWTGSAHKQCPLDVPGFSWGTPQFPCTSNHYTCNEKSALVQGTHNHGCVECDGTTEYKTMRVHHHNDEGKCSQYVDPSCTGRGFVTSNDLFPVTAPTTRHCAKKDPLTARTIGAVCGLGLVTGSANCECRPKCGEQYVWYEGACRPKDSSTGLAVKYSQIAKTLCNCENGVAKSSGCYHHADSCATCNSGFVRHRVSTATATGWECIPQHGVGTGSSQVSQYYESSTEQMNSFGTQQKKLGDFLAHNCSADNKYMVSETTSECATCPAGSYTHGGTQRIRETGTTYHWLDCSPCPAGSSCDGTHTITQCTAGTKSSAGASSCTACGTNEMSAAGATTCNTCPQGTYRSSATQCTTCEAGSACAAGSTTATKTTCDASQRKYSGEGAATCSTCATTNHISNNQCLACPAGYSCDGTSTTTQCLAGTASALGSALCGACTGNQYTSADGAAACDTCTAGNWLNGGSSGTCDSCPAGSECADGITTVACDAATREYSAGGAAACDTCATTHYISNNQCEPCTDDHSCDGTDAVPVACGNGNIGTGGVCSACGVGEYESSNTCVSCDSDKVTQGQNAQATCTTTCSSNQWIQTSDSTCQNCPAGYKCNGVAKTACEPGTSAVAGSTSCSTCGAGTYAGAAAEMCTDCGADNKYSEAGAGACRTCPAGFFTHGGNTNTHTACSNCFTDITSTAGAACRGVGVVGHCTDVGKICDGGSTKTACTETPSFDEVGTCVPLATGVDSTTSCPDAITESACNALGSTMCSWTIRSIHTIKYSENACLPTARTTQVLANDINKAGECPTCTVNGGSYLEITPDATFTDTVTGGYGVTCTDSSGAAWTGTVYASQMPTANGNFVKGTHVLTYYVVDTSGTNNNWSFGCGQDNTWTRVVKVTDYPSINGMVNQTQVLATQAQIDAYTGGAAAPFNNGNAGTHSGQTLLPQVQENV